ncbi:MAG: DUF3050 domain-containing protein [Bdellovibrionales bacterium]|nr:DUF3050 domain-containing protein [Bdellovibrionales bacterium]
MNGNVEKLQKKLLTHPLYAELDSVANLRVFMAHHIFAVWDFMCLLKAIQRIITCVDVPWRPSRYPTDMVRFINEIVLGEESDVDQNGVATSHYELYLNAMTEMGVDTAPIKEYARTLDEEIMPPAVRAFVSRNLALARSGDVIRIAAAFFYGREKLIPGMFERIVETLEREKVNAPSFIYYLKRHIQIDGEEHGPLAEKCLDLVCRTAEHRDRAETEGVNSLQARWELWDRTLDAIRKTGGAR